MELEQYIRDIPDFPKPGILFKDITPLLGEPHAFRAAVERFVAHYRHVRIDAIAAVEARGFLFAAPIALLLERPMVPLRKPGKLPYEKHSCTYDLEYGTAELECHVDSLTPGAQVLIVDDLLATGGTVEAGCKLIAKAGGVVVGCAFLVELTFLKGRERLKPHEVFSLIQY